MNITLVKNGEKKTYSQHFVSARYVRKALELRNEINLFNLSVEDMDTAVNFVVEAFGKQFSADDIYDGLSYEDLVSTIIDDVFMSILQGRKQEPKNDEGNEKK